MTPEEAARKITAIKEKIERHDFEENQLWKVSACNCLECRKGYVEIDKLERIKGEE